MSIQDTSPSNIIIEKKSGLERYISKSNSKIIAIILRTDFSGEKYNFFTPDEFPFQFGLNKYKKGDIIEPHIHKKREIIIEDVQEFVYLKKGSATLFLYDENNMFLYKVDLFEGDTVLKASGGHGYKIHDDTEIIEVKQGPYGGDNDKLRFKFKDE